MEVHVSIRPGAWVHTEPMSDFFTSRFYRDHPEWRCVARDGEAVARMSLAAPEVREHLIAVLREAVGFGADGANVLFNRGVPLILFEKPFCDLFRERHNVDPKTLKDDDPRILELRAEVLTSFMQGIREMLDKHPLAAKGRRLALSAFVLASEADNLRYGIDVRRWAREGLVDLVCPYLGAGGRARGYDLAFFAKTCTPHRVRVAPCLIAWRLPDLAEVLRRSQGFYQEGADGIAFWDPNCLAGRAASWSVVSRLGHVQEAALRADEGPPRPVTLHFHRLGGLVVDGPYNQNGGF